MSAAKLTWTKLLLGVSLVGATAVPVGYYALRNAESNKDAPASQCGAGAGGTRRDAQRGAWRDDRARLSLANGDARRALDELDGYDRRFPGGRLQLEAEVMRIDAFAKVGRKDVARQHAETFLRRHPTSVLATRVRAHLAD